MPWISSVFHPVPWIAAISSSLSWQIPGLIALTLLLLAIWYFRGSFQEARFASVLGAVVGLGQRLYVRDWGATSEKQGPVVMHVLVATDLLSGEPIYFSSKFVHCKPYGWSTPEHIRTAEALYSSAAFPGGVSPQKVENKQAQVPGRRHAGTIAAHSSTSRTEASTTISETTGLKS